jgi:tetratricopeptide (TPR) repeat protein
MRGFAKSTGLAALVLVLVVASPLAMTAARAASGLSSVTIDYLLAQGDWFAAAGEYEAARAEYEVAAHLLRDEGRLPVDALRRIANSYYFEGEYESAVATLDCLADEAESHGDLETQAFALADAAYIARLTGSRAEELRRRERLALLLISPELTDGVREKIGSKVNADFQVFAPHLSSW